VPGRPISTRERPIRVGFLPLADAAPLVAAQRRGVFARFGINVELKREVGWATVREKIRFGELDAAQAPAPMLWAMELGLGCPRCEVLTAFVLNLNGNALTLAKELGAEARNPEGMREIVRARRSSRPLTLGAVFPFSSHNLLIREWLRRMALNPDRDVRIAVVPPAQMFRNLVAGTIDGYAAGEPWNSLAVREGAGWCPLWSAALPAPQVEKVLLVTRKFAESRQVEHAALVSSLLENAPWCDDPANREAMARMLAEPGYVDLPFELIAPSLLGRFDAGTGAVETVADFHVFHRYEANQPSTAKANMLQAALQSAGLVSNRLERDLPMRLFRKDIYDDAVRMRPAGHKPM
jgi:ABC-type nitrate/sulfonate/bicarbonate transport system substrate-binding protein